MAKEAGVKPRNSDLDAVPFLLNISNVGETSSLKSLILFRQNRIIIQLVDQPNFGGLGQNGHPNGHIKNLSARTENLSN